MTSRAILPALLTMWLLSMSAGSPAVEAERSDRYRPDVVPVDNPLYRSECGSCHFAYQPGLLPARSWKRLMAGLADHFGENVELAPEDLRSISGYLVSSSADTVDRGPSAEMDKSIPKASAPLRISVAPYFVQKHREVPERLVSRAPEISSLGNCAACHTRSETGSFSKREISIPAHDPKNPKEGRLLNCIGCHGQMYAGSLSSRGDMDSESSIMDD